MRAERVKVKGEIRPCTPEQLIAAYDANLVPELARTEAFNRGETYGLKEAIEDPHYVPVTRLHQVRDFNHWTGEEEEYTVTPQALERVRAKTLAQEFFYDGFLHAAYGTLIALNAFWLAGPMAASAIMLLSIAYAFGKARESISAAQFLRNPLLMVPGIGLALLLGGSFLLFGQAFIFAAIGWKLIAAKAAATVVGGWIAQRAGNNSSPWLAHTLSGWERKIDDV